MSEPSPKKRLEELEFLVESSRLLNSTLILDELLGVILNIVKKAVSVESASLSLLDAEKKQLVYQLGRGRGTDERGLAVAVGEGISGWVAKNGKPVILNDARNDARYSYELERKLGLPAHSIICIPLKQRNKVIGVLEGVNRIGAEPFSKSDLSIFTALGDHIAAAVANARLYRQVEKRNLESRLFHAISATLSASLSLDEVLHEILTALKKIVYYDAGGIFVLDRKNNEIVSQDHHGYGIDAEERIRIKMDEGLVGWSARNRKGVIIPDCSQDTRYRNARARTRSEVVTPMLVQNNVIGVLNLENNRLNAYSEGDLVLLESFAAYAAVAIERARLYEDNRKKRELQRQVQVARTIQEFFTPRKGKRVGDYDMRGINYPGLLVSGDYYDFFPLKNKTCLFAIADVAGSGVPASIIMSGFRASLHTAAIDRLGAKEIALTANRILLETVRPQDFVTAFIGILDPATGEIVYCNAGHEPPVLMSPDGSHRMLELGGAVLGVFEDPRLIEGRFKLGDDVLFCYTDGLTEAANGDEEEFGLERVIAELRGSDKRSTSQICSGMYERLKKFAKPNDLLDDITFLVVRKKLS
jgi:serine phosphatase RsbU (regulator of sigma subunit)